MTMDLLVTHERGDCQRHSFQDAVAIVAGRDLTCDLVLDDLDVSRQHLVIQGRAQAWRIEDRSSNGTLVGTRLLCHESLELAFDAEVRVGPYRIRRVDKEDTAPRSDDDDKALTVLRRKIQRRLLDSLKLAKLDRDKLSDKEMRPQVMDGLQRLVAELRAELPVGISEERLIQELADEVLGLGPLESLLADDAVSEIMVVHPQLIYCERGGKIERTDLRFTDDDAARSAIERIVTPLGRRIDESTPFVDARLKDGSRVNAVIRPLALLGACITIRKFSKNTLALENLIAFGSMDEAMARFLRRSVQSRRNIVISGGTGSGKTTLLNVLSQSIADDERVVTIEDAAELQLDQDHVVSLETRPPNMEGRGEVTIRDLVKNALRMRPDRILVGECRGGEAIDMLQAMNTGHDGSMTTTHANSPMEAIRRLETLVLMSGLDLPARAIREQIAGSVDLIVQQSRLSDGSRKVTSIAEVVGIEDGEVQLQEIFCFRRSGTGEDGKAQGRFQATGLLPTYLEDMIRLGLITGEDYL